ncbi:MAG: hypothetical protein WAV63_00020, partial [Trichococcus flocculiformis]
IEDIHTYVQIHRYNLENCIVGGDFNSNAIWNKGHKRRNHSAVVNDLKSAGLDSAYHVLNKEIQGCETQKTFYLYRHQTRPFHIDYFFCPTTILQSFEIEPYDKWISYSDHIPIMVEIDV